MKHEPKKERFFRENPIGAVGFSGAVLSLLVLLVVVANALIGSSYLTPAKAEGNPPIIDTLVQRGFSIVPMGEIDGLEGWMGAKGGQIQTFYTIGKGTVAIIGVVIDQEGNDLTAMQMQNLLSHGQARDLMKYDGAPAPGVQDSGLQPASAGETRATYQEGRQATPGSEPKADAAQQVLDDLEHTFYIERGAKDAPVLWMVVDPNCTYCITAWNQIERKVLQGRIRVRLVVTATLGGSSIGKAAAILQASGPFKAWRLNALKQGLGGIREEDPTQATEEKLQRNMDFLTRHEISGTPFLAFIDTDRLLRAYVGLPENMDDFLKAMGAQQMAVR